MDDACADAAMDADSVAPADGNTIGDVERPTIARTENRRNRFNQSFNRGAS
jgi:hypothetical protein